MANRGDAQRRVHRIRAFRAELDSLISAGAVNLTSEQRVAIDRYHDDLLRALAAAHDVDASEAAGQLSRGMQIAAFVAAIALTAAIYSAVSRFWGRLDLPTQASLLGAFPLMALVGVEFAARRERTLYVASIFALAAFGTYWLAVATLSVLLNVPLTPLVIWGGALFGLTLALPYGFRLILAGALAALLIALAGSVFQAAGMPWTLVREFPEIITVAAFALTGLSGRLQVINAPFAAVTRLVGFGIGFIGLLLLSESGPSSLWPLPARAIELIYQAITFVGCIVLTGVALRKRWSETVYVSASALTILLWLRFIDWFWEMLPRYMFFLLVAAMAFGWLAALRKLRARLQKDVR